METHDVVVLNQVAGLASRSLFGIMSIAADACVIA
jgi:hypothetical protein